MSDVFGTLLETKRFAVHDGPGIRTAFYLKGCVLHCLWCHNPESIAPVPAIGYYPERCILCGECVTVCPTSAQTMQGETHQFDRTKCIACGKCVQVCLGRALKLYGKKTSLDEAMTIAQEDRPFFEQSGGGVTLSGGEPLVQIDFSLAFLQELKKAGIHTALDTCLCVPWERLEKTLSYTDIYLADFKCADPDQHKKMTGLSNDLVKENLQKLSDAGAKIEIRIPFVPGYNDSDDNMRQTGEFLSKLNITCVKLLPYHSLARTKYLAVGVTDTMPEAESPAEAEIQHACSILKSYGLIAKSGRES